MTDPVTLNVAARAVTCPRCHARPGLPCESTGGGNHAYVPTHAARRRRVEGWPGDRLRDAAKVIRLVERRRLDRWPPGAATALAAFDAAAAAAPTKPLSRWVK